VLQGLELSIPPGRITAIVGANACGKSTLLRSLSRLLAPAQGQVSSTANRSTRCRRATWPGRWACCRNPHHGLLSRWTGQDDAAVAAALRAAGTADLAERAVDELSGGQRQRVWIAMALAQETGLLLLDEPTTFLDIAHQIEVLDLLTDLNHARGTTIVMVLHDLNLAARYADTLVALRAGRVHAAGPPEAVLTGAMVEAVFGLPCQTLTDPVSGRPMMLPIGRHGRQAPRT